MAKKGDLPKALSKINKAKVPYLAVLLVSGLTLLLRFTLKEEESLQLFSRLIYGTFALTCLGYFSLCHRKKKRKETLFSVFAFIITAGVSSVIFLADFHLYYLIILGIFIVAVEIKQIIPINLGRK